MQLDGLKIPAPKVNQVTLNNPKNLVIKIQAKPR